jgi:hypothetical protein
MRLNIDCRRALLLVLIGLSLVLPANQIFAQTNSNVANVTLTANVLQSITVSTAVSSVTFNVSAGSSAIGAPTVPVTTIWNVNPLTVSNVSLYGYFDSSTAALTDGGTNNIPTAAMKASVNGAAYAAFTQTGPFGAAAASDQFFSQAITALNATSTRSDNVTLQLDLTSLPSQPARTYTGTLHIQAQAN